MLRLLPLLVVLLLVVTSPAQAQNLLRNGNFQDDWLTLMPELKNHHWCYSSEFYNRRDFNPDGWTCKGSWQWLNEDLPAGNRRLILQGPGATVSQRVNWVLVHDSRTMGTMADAGGFPQIKPQHSTRPLRMVGDLTLKVTLGGKDVPAKAGVLELGLCPPGQISMSEPLGTMTPPTVLATMPLPEGTFATRVVELKLTGDQWLEAMGSDKKAKQDDKLGPVLPGTVSVAIRYAAPMGAIELLHAELIESLPDTPSLLPGGDFEGPDVFGDAKTAAWSGPTKYRYFPGRLYYLFNTWHNGGYDNRGKVSLDPLVSYSGQRSLQMIVPPGDEMAVASRLITLNQKEPNLIEVHAVVKTDKLCMLHLDALDEKGNRLDGYPFIHMAPHSIGTNDWRLIRQVFRPRQPLQSIRVLLCARGVNGYTLDDTGHQPQNNVVGTIWWDDVKLFEPETTEALLKERGVMPAAKVVVKTGLQMTHLDLGERMLGDNLLTAQLANPGKQKVRVQFEFTAPSGKKSTFLGVPEPTGQVRVPYFLNEPCPDAYTEYRGKLSVLDDKNQALAATELWFGTWTVPIDIDLGALYLRPEQKQYVRMNLGLSVAALQQVASMRLEVLRRGTGEVLKSVDVSANPVVFAEQRKRIPAGLRDDFTNLLLADLDVSYLPVQAFHEPQRNWLVRVTARDKADNVLLAALSPPFCRLAHEPAQPPVQSASVKNNLLFVNNKPWMPWGVVYGHVPVYDGPADPGKYLDLRSLPAYSMYDRFTAAPYTRQGNDFNCLRYVAGSITDAKKLDEAWSKDNLYASTAFVTKEPVFSLADLEKQAGGKDKLASYLAFCKTAPMIVSTVPGIEEAFGLFHEMTPEQLKGMEQVAGYLRQQTGKPVMVGHGGYWNRLEFEKVPFFDIYDPETEPLYPANLHTDLWPLIGGKDKAIWLRPQMYEDVPFERWRYHVLVELMRGCRGWHTDIAAISAVAKEAGVPLIVDNTLATPYLVRPIEHGADIIVHSLTKFLGGHGNSVGGAIVDCGTFDWFKSGRYPTLTEPSPSYHGVTFAETFGNFAFAIACRAFSLRDLGPAISPFNAFLILTGIETLPLRMQRHCDNTLAVAEWLSKHDQVAWVNYAGLPGNKFNAMAKRYCPKGAGAVFTFGLKGGYAAGVKLVSNVKLFSHLANIGDTRSLIIHPASTTHRQLTDEARLRAGAGPDVVRLSIGLEDLGDIIADLDQALAAA